MLARPFRLLTPALAALGLVALRLASPFIGPVSPAQPGATDDAGVVFRHYL